MQRATKKIQDLLDILEQENDAPADGDIGVSGFLEYYKITHGNFRVKTKLLYKLYQRWTDTPVPSYEFTRIIFLYLKNSNPFVFINKNPLKDFLPLLEEKRPRLKPKLRTTQRYRRPNEFIKEMKWERGEHFIPAIALFQMYAQWAKKHKRRRANQRDFFIVLNLKFERKKRRPDYVYYGINQEIPMSKRRLAAIERWYNAKNKAKKQT